MNIENNSVQNAHIAKNSREKIFAVMAQHPEKKALEKFVATPYALQYAKKNKHKLV